MDGDNQYTLVVKELISYRVLPTIPCDFIMCLFLHASMQISMNVRHTTHVMSMQTVMTLMAATGVSAGQDSWEMDTTAQVPISHMHV